MKTMRKALALVLALSMILALSVTAAFAADGGKITIDNAVVGQTYTIYEILYLESYNKDAGAYAYKATDAWSDFINSDTIKGVYVEVDNQGYVTWKDGADAAAFAKLAQAYAAEKSLANQGTTVADSATVVFENLNLGYYLVDSSLGTLCSLDTTNPTVTIKEKNAEPTNVKTVEEDSTGTYGSVNDADIGQTVNFKSIITAQAGAQNYVFHDKMSAGLTYTDVTSVTLNGSAVNAANYTVKNADLGDGCTFEVVFTQAFCDTLKANDEIVISYTAVVNEKAVIGGAGNPNESSIEYGESGNTKQTPGSTTTTYTWNMKVFKHNSKNEGLAGAKFVLSKNVDGTNPIALISEGNNVYRVAKNGEEGSITEIVTDETGRFTIKGLDSDTYYLKETAAPAGYNVLKDSIKVVIDSNGKVNVTEDNANGVEEIDVLNNTGAELPSTGGIGTTIFYVLGALLVVFAGVMLVTKKRMSKEG